MARKVCDLCRTEENVDEVMIVYKFERGRPWGVDLCQRCFVKRFGDLEKMSHPVKRSNIRPQYRMKETILTPAQLGEDR